MSIKRIVVVILAVSALAVTGAYTLQTRAHAASAVDDVDTGVKQVADVYSLLEKNFADTVSADKAFYQGAIPGMLGTLDPHSNFLTPSEYAEMQRKQRAQYFGVGMVITVINNEVVAYEPFPGSPAMQAGLRRGDVITAVDGVETKGLDSGKVADLLRGPRNTQVRVTVRRPGVTDPVTMTVTRGEIQTSVVDASWLKPGIAYISITGFEAQNLSNEIESLLGKMGEKSVTGLVLDLRGNPGGLVNEAVKVAGRFLKDGQVVVSDRGRAAREQVYRAKGNPLAQDYPIVVLVDRGSASASEIVSGALQDHDRAWVMGETTFGKGLVQAQFPLSQNAALLLTIAHYYTPSGRLIQRDYTNRSFYEYYAGRRDQNENEHGEVKSTDTGRTVYGGGGITPDEKYTPPRANPFQIRVARSNAIFHFGSTYFGVGQPALPSATWRPDDATLEKFKTFLPIQQVAFTNEEFEANRKWMSDQLRSELLMRAFDKKTALRAAIQDDPEVKLAVDSLPKAQSLLARRGPVQRAASK